MAELECFLSLLITIRWFFLRIKILPAAQPLPTPVSLPIKAIHSVHVECPPADKPCYQTKDVGKHGYLPPAAFVPSWSVE